jgi:hypothetical protein
VIFFLGFSCSFMMDARSTTGSEGLKTYYYCLGAGFLTSSTICCYPGKGASSILITDLGLLSFLTCSAFLGYTGFAFLKGVL